MASVNKSVLEPFSASQLFVVVERDGPFLRLDATRTFRPLAADACKVDLALSDEFATRALETVIGAVFNHIADSFIDAFVRRADVVYAT